jgi:hypothetical protein
MINHRSFLTLGACPVASALGQTPTQAAGAPDAASPFADPGVWDVSEPWLRNLPQILRDMMRDGKKDVFDQVMANAAKDPRTQTPDPNWLAETLG